MLSHTNMTSECKIPVILTELDKKIIEYRDKCQKFNAKDIVRGENTPHEVVSYHDQVLIIDDVLNKTKIISSDAKPNVLYYVILLQYNKDDSHVILSALKEELELNKNNINVIRSCFLSGHYTQFLLIEDKICCCNVMMRSFRAKVSSLLYSCRIYNLDKWFFCGNRILYVDKLNPSRAPPLISYYRPNIRQFQIPENPAKKHALKTLNIVNYRQVGYIEKLYIIIINQNEIETSSDIIDYLKYRTNAHFVSTSSGGVRVLFNIAFEKLEDVLILENTLRDKFCSAIEIWYDFIIENKT